MRGQDKKDPKAIAEPTEGVQEMDSPTTSKIKSYR
jgi:hypothetical protein